MPHQCTNCGRGFEDGSQKMLSGCPNCGGNKFQFRPEGADSPPPEDDPPEPPEPPGANSAVAKVGKTAAKARDLVGGEDEPSVGAEPAAHSDDTGVEETDSDSDDISAWPTDTDSDNVDAWPTNSGSDNIDARPTDTEDAAQASARGGVVSPDELPDHDSSPDELPDHDIGDGDSHSEPPSADAAASVEPPADDDQPDVGTDDSDSHSEPPSADAAASVEPPADDAQPDLQELREELNEQFESVKVLAPGQYELNLMELYDRKEYIVALQEDGHYSIQVPEAIQE